MTPEEELFGLLQTKKAEGELVTNENESTVGTVQLHEDPEGRAPSGETESPWGEPGPTEGGRPNQAFHNSSGAWEEHKKGRQGLVDHAFADRRKADAAAQALVKANFEHGRKGEFNAHSLHLQGISKEKISHPRTSTLMEQVKKAIGKI